MAPGVYISCVLFYFFQLFKLSTHKVLNGTEVIKQWKWFVKLFIETFVDVLWARSCNHCKLLLRGLKSSATVKKNQISLKSSEIEIVETQNNTCVCGLENEEDLPLGRLYDSFHFIVIVCLFLYFECRFFHIWILIF